MFDHSELAGALSESVSGLAARGHAQQMPEAIATQDQDLRVRALGGQTSVSPSLDLSEELRPTYPEKQQARWNSALQLHRTAPISPLVQTLSASDNPTDSTFELLSCTRQSLPGQNFHPFEDLEELAQGDHPHPATPPFLKQALLEQGFISPLDLHRPSSGPAVTMGEHHDDMQGFETPGLHAAGPNTSEQPDPQYFQSQLSVATELTTPQPSAQSQQAPHQRRGKNKKNKKTSSRARRPSKAQNSSIDETRPSQYDLSQSNFASISQYHNTSNPTAMDGQDTMGAASTLVHGYGSGPLPEPSPHELQSASSEGGQDASRLGPFQQATGIIETLYRAHPELRRSSQMNDAVHQLMSLIPADRQNPTSEVSNIPNNGQAGTGNSDMGYQSQAPIVYQPQLSPPKDSTPIQVTIGELYNGQQMSKDDARKLSSTRNEKLPPMTFDWLNLSNEMMVDEQLGIDDGGHLYLKRPAWAPKKPPRIILQGGEIFDPNHYAQTINEGVCDFLSKETMPAHLHLDADLRDLTAQQKFHRRKIQRIAWQLWCARELCCRDVSEAFAIERLQAIVLRHVQGRSLESAVVATWSESPSTPRGWAWIGKDQVLYHELKPIDLLGFFEHQLSMFNGDQEAMLRARPQPTLPAMYPPDRLIDSMRP
ncbi:hypothetical protein PFICI_15108 [Pestalotiopsis fici W106-1]|uniref:Uncharacterized protein n=1 Tax=Pestalotiopsis fici (strain W106-1 / CGMCC3.15140) TaxID=1229662 RepID=W3WGZ3_PESFW|nr:uncharacterized protein PFICI_15108 [Pestalotiopsis fici W106-1]ETS73163.1 hypothetical protein PFICI_15108 [Pestalotiopsis fici W106-1]